MPQKKRRRGPNRSIESRIAELQAEVDRLQARREASQDFSPAAVRKHRAKLEVSAADYAVLVGVSPLTVYNWEKGRTKPQQAQLERWLEVSEMKPEDAWAELGYE